MKLRGLKSAVFWPRMYKETAGAQLCLKGYLSCSVLNNQALGFFIKTRIPIMIKSPQIIRPTIDFGPVISFTGFFRIRSTVQINIAPKTPITINIMPFFIPHLLSLLIRYGFLPSVLLYVFSFFHAIISKYLFAGA